MLWIYLFWYHNNILKNLHTKTSKCFKQLFQLKYYHTFFSWVQSAKLFIKSGYWVLEIEYNWVVFGVLKQRDCILICNNNCRKENCHSQKMWRTPQQLFHAHVSLKIPMIMLIIFCWFPIKVRNLNFDDRTILFVHSHAAGVLRPKQMALLWWFYENTVYTFVSSIECESLL